MTEDASRAAHPRGTAPSSLEMEIEEGLMLHIKKVLDAKPKEHVEAELATMYTPWGEALDPAHVLEEHPTPQFARAMYRTLNGTWECGFIADGHDPTEDLVAVVEQAPVPQDDEFAYCIVVPFSPEAPLSGVGRQLQPNELLWYRRSFDAPERAQDERVLLHFQAVDYACAVRVNGHIAGSHAGGYTPFAFDITELLHDGTNELLVCVADPSEFGGRLRGKQRFDRGDIWYTAQSGIWQTAWLEVVPKTHISFAQIDADSHTGILAVGVYVEQAGDPAAQSQAKRGLTAHAPSFVLEVLSDDGAVIASNSSAIEGGTAAAALQLPDVRIWSPEDPYLYRLRLRCGDDAVDSYCAFRAVEMKRTDDGHLRVFLNGEQLFIKGVLDQGYWSDGLMTAPSDDALVADIQAMHDAGFNLMRKHIKIESERWYYHCDRLGMLVVQDMVTGGAPEINLWHWSYKPTLFKVSWNHFGDNMPGYWKRLGSADEAYRAEWTATCREAIRLLGNHPCIIGWSLFNEGWGQFNAKRACKLVRSLDATRFIDAVSGWYDQRCGDFSSVHNYFRDLDVWRDKRHGRAFIISEFGGFTHHVDGHSALDEAYGYEPYDDIAEWRKAMRALLAEAEALEPKGLVGYVYTQVSDIEEETNGILTYDRRINKLNA